MSREPLAGRVDLAIVGEDDELIEVLLQDADGEPSWTVYTIPGTSESTAFWAAALADIDGDGRLDLIAVSREDAMRITWWHNDPSILPSSWIPRDVIYDPDTDENRLFYAVDVGDLDGDSDVDIVSPIRTNDDIGDAYRNPSAPLSESRVAPLNLILRDTLCDGFFLFLEQSLGGLSLLFRAEFGRAHDKKTMDLFRRRSCGSRTRGTSCSRRAPGTCASCSTKNRTTGSSRSTL